jgi:starvation-inducible DNA-binding protein
MRADPSRVAEDELQRQLRDLLCLAVVADHVRWVLTDDRDAELAGWLAVASGTWRDWADQVARQLVVSGVAPDGRVRSLAKDLPLNWVPEGWLAAEAGRRLIAERLRTVSGWANNRRSQASGTRAEVLDVVCAGFTVQLHVLHDMAARHA